MKKTYVAPWIAVEHYELTQTIADCSVKIGASGSMSCVGNDGDAPWQMRDLASEYPYYFISEPDLCKATAKYDEYENGICYHTNTVLTFHS